MAPYTWRAAQLEQAVLHCKKERAEITCIRVLIECPKKQHRVHACCLVPVLF